MFEDNKVLGTFNLDGIPPAPRGVPQIEITYDLDANGILNVSAKDLGTQKEQHITITSSSGLTDAEIEKAKSDAEKYKAEDEKRAALVIEKNSADALCFNIEKTLKDNTEKVSETEKKAIEDAITKVKEELKGSESDKLKAAVEELNKAWEPVIRKIYPNNSNTGNTPNFSSEDIEKMKNDPKFANFFQEGGPFAGGMNNNGFTQPPSGTSQDSPVDAEVVD